MKFSIPKVSTSDRPPAPTFLAIGALRGLIGLGVATLIALLIGDAWIDGSFYSLASFFSGLVLLTALAVCAALLFAVAKRASGPIVITVLLVFLLLWSPVSSLYDAPGSYLLTAALMAAVALIGIGLKSLIGAVWIHRGAKRPLFVGLLATGAGIWLAWVAIEPAEARNDFPTIGKLTDRTLPLSDPGAPGSFDVQTFRYGSGRDLHRPRYAENVDWIAPTVDGSALLEDWRDLKGTIRTRYWGFGPEALPLQGIVYAPKSGGPFPIVLILHGNHPMEQDSDAGYAWLGRHLASHGYLTISIDENFLNHTNADDVNPLSTGLQNETDARAWLALQHFAAWRRWTGDRNHRFFQSVDWEHVGLIGHSRGGEAVAAAAAFDGLGAYPDDASVKLNANFGIDAIVALAPDDQKYRPRGSSRNLDGVDYLAIHGGMDADVRSFRGAVQYERVDLADARDSLKATAYIGEANHAQFNSAWGRHDTGFPYRLFLNDREVMEGTAQRRATAVFATAFLHASLQGRTEYLPVFADAARAKGWLPDAHYIMNMERGDARPLANFEEDIDPVTASIDGARLFGEELEGWRETRVSMRWDTPENHVAEIAWVRGKRNAPPRFGVHFEVSQALAADAALTFAASVADANSKSLDWSIVITDIDGEDASIPLRRQQKLFPQFRAHTLRGLRFDATPPTEPVFQRFSFPVRAFKAANPSLNLGQIRSVQFVFDQSRAGRVSIDDLSILPR